MIANLLLIVRIYYPNIELVFIVIETKVTFKKSTHAAGKTATLLSVSQVICADTWPFIEILCTSALFVLIEM